MNNISGVLCDARYLLAELQPHSGYFLVFYGLIECYVSSRFFKYFMAITGFLIGLFIGPWLPLGWIEMIPLRFLVISLLGMGIGAILFFFRFIRIFVKGVLVFFTLGAVILHLFKVVPNNTLFLGISLLGGLIFLISDRGTRIVGLSALGAYFFLYGCLLSWGWETYTEMSFVFNVTSLDFRLIGLIMGWILLFTTGVVFQIKITS